MRFTLTKTISPSGTLTSLVTEKSMDSAALEAEISKRAATFGTLLSGSSRNVVIAQSDEFESLIDLFAVWRAGGCAAILSPASTDHEIATVVDLLDPAFAIVGDRPLETTVPLVVGAQVPSSAAGQAQSVAPSDAAVILFTSGTSGTPKGVVLSHGALQARVALNIEHIGADPLQRTLNLLPVHFGHGLIGNCLTPLASGGHLFLGREDGPGPAMRLGQTIDDNDITFMSSVPGIWKLALRMSPKPEKGTLKRVHIGSAPLSEGLWREISEWSGAPVWNMYGLTETSNWVAGTNEIETAKVGTLWGGSARIKDANGEWQNEGQGELWLNTPSLMTEYFDRAELTSEVLQDGWFNTGDVAELSSDGVIRLVGRSRYMINIDGTKVYPEEIDLLFEQHPAISDVCAFAMPDSASGEQLALAYVSDGEIEATDLKDWASSRLRSEAIPRIFSRVETMPRTDRGKLNRDLVRDVILERNKA